VKKNLYSFFLLPFSFYILIIHNLDYFFSVAGNKSTRDGVLPSKFNKNIDINIEPNELFF
jgi:hypothetical protein